MEASTATINDATAISKVEGTVGTAGVTSGTVGVPGGLVNVWEYSDYSDSEDDGAVPPFKLLYNLTAGATPPPSNFGGPRTPDYTPPPSTSSSRGSSPSPRDFLFAPTPPAALIDLPAPLAQVPNMQSHLPSELFKIPPPGYHNYRPKYIEYGPAVTLIGRAPSGEMYGGEVLIPPPLLGSMDHTKAHHDAVVHWKMEKLRLEKELEEMVERLEKLRAERDQLMQRYWTKGIAFDPKLVEMLELLVPMVEDLQNLIRDCRTTLYLHMRMEMVNDEQFAFLWNYHGGSNFPVIPFPIPWKTFCPINPTHDDDTQGPATPFY